MLTTGTTTRWWWPVVNETTESKINKIKGKEIGSGHRTRGTTRPRDPIRPDSNAYPIRLNENNNSSLIIISYLSIDRSISTFHSLAPSIAIPSTISTATGFKSNSTTATVLLLSHGPHRETGSPETCWWGEGKRDSLTKTRLTNATYSNNNDTRSPPLQHFSRIFQWHLAGSRQTPCFLSTALTKRARERTKRREGKEVEKEDRNETKEWKKERKKDLEGQTRFPTRRASGPH